ncbi:MAG: TonB-dependent receptor [Saprospiraceae bacterium]
MKKIILYFIALWCTINIALAQKRISGDVRDKADGQALVGANVVVKGTSNGAATDADGNFSFQASENARILVVSYTGYISQELEIPNTGILNITMSTDANMLESVVVSVGSRNTLRTVTDAPLPIDILNSSDLRSTGQNTFDKALQYRVPSFNSVQTPVNDATSLLDPYEIRNMGPSRTLILINGKRKNLSSLVYIQTAPGRGETGADISAIPTDAIKRVEILRDGASAQYGSDAIAGVMNIILKDKYDYGSITFNTGISNNSSASDFKVGGKYLDKVKAWDGRTFGVSINNGSNIGDKGFINYTVSLSQAGLANRPGTISSAAEADVDLGFDASIADVKKFLAEKPDAGNVNGSPETTAGKFCIYGGYNLSDNTEMYFNAAYVYKKVNSFANYRTPYWRSISDSEGWQLYANNGDPSTYKGYVPTFEGDLNDYHATVGFKSNLGMWKSDVSFTTGGNNQFYTVANSRNRSLGVNSPILFKPGGYSFSHNVANIDISRPISEHFSFAFGTEFRAEKYTIAASKDTASYVGTGADSFPGITPNNGGDFTRFNIGAYADLAYDVTKDFLINGTFRTEKYSDFGNANVYKLSSRYKMLDDKFTLRGSYSTGFRAPTLHQINQQIAQASFVPGQGIQTKGIVNNRSAQAKLLGVEQLKAETSKNITVGVGFNPTKQLSITLDYYNIHLKDRIVLGSEIEGTDAGNTALDKVLKDNGIVAVSLFTNALSTKTSGIDLVANYRGLTVGPGRMNINLAGNYQIQNELDTNSSADKDGTKDGINNPVLIANAGKSVFDKIQEALLLSSRPKFKGILGLDYTVGKFNFNLNNTLFGPTRFHQNGLNDDTDTEFLPALVTDLGISYQITKKATLSVNANNLFNVKPKWEFIDLKTKKRTRFDQKNLNNSADPYFAQYNLITFNGRYATTTYDGSQFSQLGLMLNASLNVRF